MLPQGPIKLDCGHSTSPDTNPKAVHPDGRKLYECPVCGKLSYGGSKR